jgi:hypothetical protein
MADDISPESFHDASQTILSPGDSLSTAPATAPQGVISIDTSGDGSTPSPLHQRRQLFPTKKKSPSADGTPQYICQASCEGQ